MFAANGTISVTLPDGTPVGSPGGAPTVIPAGFYTVMFSGPAGTTGVPYFQLTGPGVDILENMDEGGAVTATTGADLLPDSTYTWTNNATPGVAYTFVTSAAVEGTAPPSTSPASTSSTAPSQDVVGSALPAARRMLRGTVTAAGRLELHDGGTPVTRLRPGRYTITVTDRSATSGFLLRKGGGPPAIVTGAAFVGVHSTSLELTRGRWDVASGAHGEKTYFTVAP